MGNFVNFVILSIVIKSAIAKSGPVRSNHMLKAVLPYQLQNQVNININGESSFTIDDDSLSNRAPRAKLQVHSPCSIFMRLLNEYLNFHRMVRFPELYANRSKVVLNNTENHLINKRSLLDDSYETREQISGKVKSEEPTTDSSVTYKLVEKLLASKNAEEKNDIVPVEDSMLASDLNKEIKTQDADAEVIRCGKEFPKGDKQLMFIQEVPGNSISEQIDDFLKQVEHREVEVYNSIEAKREGLEDDEEGDEDSESDA